MIISNLNYKKEEDKQTAASSEETFSFSSYVRTFSICKEAFLFLFLLRLFRIPSPKAISEAQRGNTNTPTLKKIPMEKHCTDIWNGAAAAAA